MMKRLISILTSGIFLISCAATPGSSFAADGPNILIMGEDADRDTVPRNSRVFKRVLDALSGQLNDEGFDVFDEAAVSLDEGLAQGRVRRTDAEIIDIARIIKRPPIDVAVIFSIFASAKEMSYVTKVKTRIPGRILNVKTGQRLGNFEVESPREWVAPVNCDRKCTLEVVGGHAKILAQDLGAVLTEKLAWMVDDGESDVTTSGVQTSGLPNAYTLVFNLFTSEERMDIEEYLVVFSGYKSHRISGCSERRCEYWYESDIETAKLNRNLRKMLDYLNMRGRVTFSGNLFTVDKITLRKDRPERPPVNPDEW